jgi:hypothetical protein
MAQWSSQVNWTMIMSSRGWHALHGLAELPATLGTGIRRVGGVRARQFRLSTAMGKSGWVVLFSPGWRPPVFQAGGRVFCRRGGG